MQDIKTVFFVKLSDERMKRAADRIRAFGYTAVPWPENDAFPSDVRAVCMLEPNKPVNLKTALALPDGAALFYFNADIETESELDRKNIMRHRYFDDERLLEKNAAITAEGAIAIVIENTPVALEGARVLVLGHGRVGKAAAMRLHLLGARVTAADKAEMLYGYKAKGISYPYPIAEVCESLESAADYDAIINTAPALLLKGEVLKTLSEECLVLDLASGEGGADKAAAAALSVKLIHALGVPGKVAPKSAGWCLADSVLDRVQKQ